MSHPTNEQLMEYLYGELDSKQRRKLEDHLEQCSECQANIRDFQSVMAELDKWKLPTKTKVIRMPLNIPTLAKWAVAAVILIAGGYIGGLLSAPDYAISDSMMASLGSAIKQDVLEQLRPELQSAFAKSNTQLKNELSQQLQQCLYEFANQTLNASSTITKQMLVEVVETIDEVQAQQHRQLVDTLKEIEKNQLDNDSELRDGLVNLANYTTNELQNTKQEVANWLTYSGDNK
ncbi:MAG: anti-sigma factor family protein [Planctomycetota bacterium]|jgi:hypothetical protein